MDSLGPTMRKVSLAFADCRSDCPLLGKWSLVLWSLYIARQKAEVMPWGWRDMEE